MTVGMSGTSEMPIVLKQPKTEKSVPEEIKVFPKDKIPREPVSDHGDRNPQVELKTNVNTPMIEILGKLPESMRNKLTQDMQKAIKEGITVGEFLNRYGSELVKNHNHGV